MAESVGAPYYSALTASTSTVDGLLVATSVTITIDSAIAQEIHGLGGSGAGDLSFVSFSNFDAGATQYWSTVPGQISTMILGAVDGSNQQLTFVFSPEMVVPYDSTSGENPLMGQVGRLNLFTQNSSIAGCMDPAFNTYDASHIYESANTNASNYQCNNGNVIATYDTSGYSFDGNGDLLAGLMIDFVNGQDRTIVTDHLEDGGRIHVEVESDAGVTTSFSINSYAYQNGEVQQQGGNRLELTNVFAFWESSSNPQDGVLTIWLTKN